MRVDIVGCGPTGMSIAWELVGLGHKIHMYDKKPSAGGSWWEPPGVRDFHSHRMVFKQSFINTNSLFDEMGIKWDDIFEPSQDDTYSYLLKNLSLKDYLLLVKVVFMQSKDKTLEEVVGTEDVSPIIKNISYNMDGVPWNHMTSYEFVESFNHVGLSRSDTQKGSGRPMCLAMQKALEKKGTQFHFDTELQNVVYKEGSYEATFSDGEVMTSDMMILCLDHLPMSKLVDSNWGPTAKEVLVKNAYGCINVLFTFEEAAPDMNDIETVSTTSLKILAKKIDENTLSCVLCEMPYFTPPDVLVDQIKKELDIAPKSHKICWGSRWSGGRWVHDQTSGVIGVEGPLPFFGNCPKVAMCGMMSSRNTPYASLEAAVEVGRRFCHENFGTRKPYRPITISLVMTISVTLMILVSIKKK